MNMTGQSRALVWRTPLLALVLVLTIVMVLYRETAAAMVTIWYRSGTFNHAFVVLPITLWLIWRRRHDLALLVPKPAPLLLLPLAGLALAWLMGDLTAVNSVTQLAFVAMLVLSVPVVLGIQVAWLILFPLAFLFFSVPIGEFLMPWFMEMTADFTVAALRLTGVPVLREGLQFVIPSGNWSVVEACSGIRYLIASVTVGTLFAYLNYQSSLRRVLFVLASILVPVVANWLRAYMIVMLGHLSGNTIAVGVDHLIYGWVFFGVVIMLMFVIGSRWSEPEPHRAPGLDRLLAGPPVPPTTPGRLWFVALVSVVLVALPLAAKWNMDRQASIGTAALAVPVLDAKGWQIAGPMPLTFKPDFKNPSAEVNAIYGKSDRSVGVYLAYYRNQDYSRKLVSSENVLVTNTDKYWSRVTGGGRVAVFGDDTQTVRTMELRRNQLGPTEQSGRLIAWQVYWIDGTLTASDHMAKLYSAVYQILGRGDNSATIVVYTPKDSAGGAHESLQSFMAENYAAIDTALRQAKSGK
ncbi:MAG: exosortase A [Rhodoferax sp.]|nr:exosortase A [Rhodoferax sp.]